MPDDEHEREDGSQEERLDRLEHTQAEQGTKLDAILEKLGHVVPSSHAEAEERQERRLDRPSNVAEQVQAELAKAREEEARQASRAEHETEHERIKAEQARLREAPPLPPARRATKLLGWGDGRDR